MKKRKMRRRNPIARAVRRIRPQVVPSAKGYKRLAKHKGHSEINRNDLFLFPFQDRISVKITPPPTSAS
ncbi:MAG: hypothetical protein HQ512_07680 [Rhodospirillales bacterium]|nr:hypothetical protein [Rhodospirillales bacterium]